jgi:hypothetical protein
VATRLSKNLHTFALDAMAVWAPEKSVLAAPKLQQPEYHGTKNTQKICPEELHCCIP